MWRKATGTGADLLWRIRTDHAGPQPEYREDLPDGSWLAVLRRSTGPERRLPPMPVRVIDYSIDDGRDHPGSYRLFTTILDPAEAPAAALASTYHQRWEIELAFDELKTHQRGPRTVLRSKSPDLVRQEIWGHLCCHYAIRSLMAAAAEHAGHEPDRTSFVAALRIARATIAHAGDSPLTTPHTGWSSYDDSSPDSTQPDGTEPHPASSNERCRNGRSNAPTTPTGPNPIPTPPTAPTASSTLTERYWV